MFRLLSKQAVKAARRPRLPLCSGTTARGVHKVQAPYSEPPSYKTIARRLSSPVDPQTYSNPEHEQEAIGHGEFVDIYDLGNPDPRDYGIWITGIEHAKLQREIAEMVGFPYHSPAFKEDADKVVSICEGVIYGENSHIIFPAVVSHKPDKAYWAFFLLHPHSRLTYLSTQTSDLLGIKNNDRGASVANIAGYLQGVYRAPTFSQHAKVEILGADFTRAHNVSLWVDWPNRRAKLYMGGDCRGPPVMQKPQV